MQRLEKNDSDPLRATFSFLILIGKKRGRGFEKRGEKGSRGLLLSSFQSSRSTPLILIVCFSFSRFAIRTMRAIFVLVLVLAALALASATSSTILRRISMKWTEEDKQLVIRLYKSQNNGKEPSTTELETYLKARDDCKLPLITLAYCSFSLERNIYEGNEVRIDVKAKKMRRTASHYFFFSTLS